MEQLIKMNVSSLWWIDILNILERNEIQYFSHNFNNWILINRKDFIKIANNIFNKVEWNKLKQTYTKDQLLKMYDDKVDNSIIYYGVYLLSIKINLVDNF